MGKSKNEYEYYLRNWMVVLLLVLYSFYIISGISIAIYVLCIYDFESEIMMHTLMASFATCLMTCSMQYIKRLYKAGITSYFWGDDMDEQEKEKEERQLNLNKFNSITQKVKPENQNQTHNLRKEGIAPINQKR